MLCFLGPLAFMDYKVIYWCYVHYYDDYDVYDDYDIDDDHYVYDYNNEYNCATVYYVVMAALCGSGYRLLLEYN